MDENVAKYRRYIVDISGVGPSRHDFCKRKSFFGKIEKNRSISVIYRRYIDKLPIYPTQIRHKNAGLRKIKKKNTKTAYISAYIANISAIYADISAAFLALAMDFIYFQKRKRKKLWTNDQSFSYERSPSQSLT